MDVQRYKNNLRNVHDHDPGWNTSGFLINNQMVGASNFPLATVEPKTARFTGNREHTHTHQAIESIQSSREPLFRRLNKIKTKRNQAIVGHDHNCGNFFV